MVDTSVALKWFVEEPLRDAAAALLDGDELLVAPDFAMAKVANALWRKARKGEVTPEQVGRAIAEMRALLVLRPIDADLTQGAFRIAQSIGHSVYDCLFPACAAQEKAQFVTADAKLMAKLSGRSDFSNVRLLT